MIATITYTTEDGKKFDNSHDAKKHECELTSHKWEFYNSNLGLQKVQEQNEDTKMKFCKHCSSQVMLK